MKLLHKLKLIILSLFLLPSICLAGVLFDAVDDVIDCGSDSALDNMSTFTYSAWIYPTGYGGGSKGRIIQKGNNVSGGKFLYYTNVDVNAPSIALWVQWTTYGKWYSPATPFALNTWNHIAATYDTSATTNNAIIYINGTSVSLTSTAPTGTITSDAAASLAIGNESTVFSRAFQGIIDEVAVWNSILTANEISILANSRLRRMPLQIQPANLKLYLPLESVSDGASADGVVFKDLSGNTNNGTANDGANNTGCAGSGEVVLSY